MHLAVLFTRLVISAATHFAFGSLFTRLVISAASHFAFGSLFTRLVISAASHFAFGGFIHKACYLSSLSFCIWQFIHKACYLSSLSFCIWRFYSQGLLSQQPLILHLAVLFTRLVISAASHFAFGSFIHKACYLSSLSFCIWQFYSQGLLSQQPLILHLAVLFTRLVISVATHFAFGSFNHKASYLSSHFFEFLASSF